MRHKGSLAHVRLLCRLRSRTSSLGSARGTRRWPSRQPYAVRTIIYRCCGCCSSFAVPNCIVRDGHGHRLREQATAAAIGFRWILWSARAVQYARLTRRTIALWQVNALQQPTLFAPKRKHRIGKSRSLAQTCAALPQDDLALGRTYRRKVVQRC